MAGSGNQSKTEYFCRRSLPMEVIKHDEYLQFVATETARKILDPLVEKVSKKIYDSVKEFIKEKRILPGTCKDVYRNWEPINLRVRYLNEDIDAFRDKLETEVSFR